MSIQFGSRLFAPRPFTTLLTLALLAMLISLGRWQLHRAAEKQVLYDSFAAGAARTTRIDAGSPPLPRYRQVAATGRYDPSRQVLIDNMVNEERAGYYVITPFLLSDGGWILVNRGWVPVGTSRAVTPDIAVSDAPRQIRGRADHLPAAGIQLGKRQALLPPFPVVASFPTHAEIEQLLKERAWNRAGDVILLDPAQPDGYVRHWSAPGFPPLRHIGYAVQWFGLALALAVIYVVTNVRRVPAAGRVAAQDPP